LFGSERRIRRPVLLAVVYGGFLVIVGITAVSQAGVVSADLTSTSLEAVVGSDATTVRNLANQTLLRSDVASPGPSAERVAQLQSALETLIRRGQIVHADIRAPDGTVIASDESSVIGQQFAPDADFAQALRNDPAIAIIPSADAGYAAGGRDTTRLLREHLPLSVDGQVQAIVTVYRDALPMLDRIDSARRDVVTVTLSAAVIVCVLLFLIFRAAQGRLTRQTEELIRTAREDALTGLLNHGTMIGLVATGIESARADDGSFGLALVDIDNFRLLNQHRGHEVGDAALVRVANAIREVVPPGAIVGRYGPDEFLVIVERDHIADLEPAMEWLRTTLADVALDVGGEDPLPITISAGIATFPLDGRSLTAILSILARTLEVARSSGGDAVRIARAEPVGESAVGGYDVLRGLVLAIDTKDRYTKRHSEDVARYAVFLGRQMGLEEAQLAAIERAGVLHDIGKIGIPDTILRKPGRLTAEEYAIVKQHVALGDMIVRDVPDLDLVRAGIRHHHERWDGAGYLAGLSGEEIPLVARILSVGDAFSAMTTSRPYRKALSVSEALRRLEDAAGSQLDERLVTVFVSAIETVADAPLPGNASSSLWTPAIEVA
jgi:diguanylate cyclase (GGDEF)-like protein